MRNKLLTALLLLLLPCIVLIGAMNNVQNRVREIVNQELIYS